MLIKTAISGTLWGWYKWQGYLFKTDQTLTAANSTVVFMEPGQGELGANLSVLDGVIPSTTLKNGNLPEIVGGKYVTYIQPQYANWVNASDVSTWFESIFPSLGIPYSEAVIFALSLGGLASQYLSQQNAKMKFAGAAFYDGFMVGTVTIAPANIIANCAQMLIVDDLGDSTVLSAQNSQLLFTDITNANAKYPVSIINLPGSAHDTWDHGFDPNNKGADSFFQFLLASTTPPVAVVPPVVVTPPAPAIIFTVGSAGTYQLTKIL